MASSLIPPNGFLGLGNQTLAVQTLTQRAMGGRRAANGTRGRKRRKSPAAAPARRRRRTAKKAKGRTVLRKGSAAAKAWGAKMRRLRKRRAKK